MRPIYNYHEKNLEIANKKSGHFPPHIHSSMECVYITRGSLELGIGQEFYHMEQGDFAIVFPDVIHHYQVFDPVDCTSTYLFASPLLSGSFAESLQKFCPENPVIPRKNLHPDVIYILNRLLTSESKKEPEKYGSILQPAFVQIILARCLPHYNLIEKGMIDSNDLVYQAVSYLARNFTEEVTLTSMARDLGVSPYVLSRVFSGTFHMNFNQYLNDLRLNCACTMLIHTNRSITDVALNAGFESQRTFNRVFKERFHISPRDYRNQNRTFSSSDQPAELNR
ncbi:MAG: AraC family transcriptional regulator [Lachnospiraceae bacterium]|nr:AraC family transcriptional regulator [Lachnospiraceae bacterium]